MTTYKDSYNAWKKDRDTKSIIKIQLIDAALKFASELAKNLALQDERYNLNGEERKYVRLNQYKNEEKSEDNFFDIPMFKNEDIFYIDYVLSLVSERDEKSSQRTDFYIPFKNYIENENLIIQVNDGRPQSDKTRFEMPRYKYDDADFQAPVEEYKRMMLEKYKAF